MTRDEFCKYHWNYYMALEKDFLGIERYLTFDLGDNNSYDEKKKIKYFGNSKAFSVEFIKQYQTICSEVDVIFKTICKDLKNEDAKEMEDYTKTILANTYWSGVVSQKVLMRDVKLQPFFGWQNEPYKAISWWSTYNYVKHRRLNNFGNANLKNVINALAGLYILEMYYLKSVVKENEMDIPDRESELFALDNWETRFISKNGLMLKVTGEDEFSFGVNGRVQNIDGGELE